MRLVNAPGRTAANHPHAGPDGRGRAVIADVRPRVDGEGRLGRYAVKRCVGDRLTVEADVFTDGHDAVAAAVRHRKAGDREWSETPMRPLGNDRWAGEFPLPELGRYEYTVVAWVDHFASWRRDLQKRLDAGQDVALDLLVGAELIERAADRANGAAADLLREHARTLRGHGSRDVQVRLALSPTLDELARAHADRDRATEHPIVYPVTVDPVLARFGAWYELFPRSASPKIGAHGTLLDVVQRLDDIAAMGFQVLYLPPIHPIGRAHRKGKNNSVRAEPGDVGSPWAIGAAEGGHTAVHPDLGTLDDFDALVREARRRGIQIALDIAFQVSPDHPYVRDHPGWFTRRPDGTIQYAENPPKKYQDIYPFNFESDDWRGLWNELRDVVLFWCARGVTVFRVDNPHTKALPFWEWMIAEVKAAHPETIFLAEAFTRPKVMHELAKLGFSQSYTYFAWRNGKRELERYLEELTQTEAREYFRPNLWPNTPDILTEHLQHGGRAAFVSRLVLAATLGAAYGIYGPAFERCINLPAKPGSEEYLDSEKYQVVHWGPEPPDSLRDLVARLNQIRRTNHALHDNRTLRFHAADNDQITCYSKTAAGPDGRVTNAVVCAVNLDPHREQWARVELDLEALGIAEDETYQMHDLLTGARYPWRGRSNVVGLDPRTLPAHVFAVRRRLRTERDFEYFL